MAKRIQFPPPRTEGHRLLRTLDKTHKELSHLTTVSHGTTTAWIRNNHIPQPHIRARLFNLFGIPISAWEVEPVEQGLLPTIVAPEEDINALRAQANIDLRNTDKIDPTTTLGACMRLLNEIRETVGIVASQLSEADNPETARALADTRAALVLKEVNVLRLKAKLEFDAFRVRDIILKEHPDWVRLRDGLVRCFVGCPNCLPKVSEYLDKSRL